MGKSNKQLPVQKGDLPLVIEIPYLPRQCNGPRFQFSIDGTWTRSYLWSQDWYLHDFPVAILVVLLVVAVVKKENAHSRQGFKAISVILAARMSIYKSF